MLKGVQIGLTNKPRENYNFFNGTVTAVVTRFR